MNEIFKKLRKNGWSGSVESMGGLINDNDAMSLLFGESRDGMICYDCHKHVEGMQLDQWFREQGMNSMAGAFRKLLVDNTPNKG